MARSTIRWSRAMRAGDAASLAYLLVLVVLLASRRASAIEALGIVFAVPIYLAGVVCVARWIDFALTGRPARPLQETQAPRPHLGRPSWERQRPTPHAADRHRQPLTYRRRTSSTPTR